MSQKENKNHLSMQELAAAVGVVAWAVVVAAASDVVMDAAAGSTVVAHMKYSPDWREAAGREAVMYTPMKGGGVWERKSGGCCMQEPSGQKDF